jgi:glycosyltransferase involved in cell wall biosynthesis
MRVTFVLPNVNLRGGVRVVATYAERLLQRGHHVTIAYGHRQPLSLRHRMKSFLRGRGWPSANLDDATFLRSFRGEHRFVERWSPVDERHVPEADAIVATWWETAEWVAKLSPGKGAKAYFIQDHEIFPGQPVDRVRATYRLPMHKIAVSQWLIDIMADEYNDTEVSRVANGVDTELFHATPREKQTVPTVGVLYTAVPRKGCDLAFQAVEIARKGIPGLRMVSFGSKPPTLECPLPRGTSFVLKPPQDRIREIYASCDAWLFPSRHEGFGLPILEAMSCRTPVIGAPAGAAPEILNQGGGVLIKPENPDGMAEAILKMHRMNQQEWSRLSEEAFSIAQQYTWRHSVDLFEQALLRAVQRAEHGEIAGGRSSKGLPS